MIVFLANAINIIVQLITLLVIIKIFLSYFMSPYHPVRMSIDRFVDPLLLPIRKIVPLVGMLDLSPLILIVIVQLVGRIIISILLTLPH